MQEQEYKLVGLTKIKGEIHATCEPLDKEETFHAKIIGDDDSKQKMWDYLEGSGDYKQLVASIRHDGYLSDGMPKNPLLLHFQYKR